MLLRRLRRPQQPLRTLAALSCLWLLTIPAVQAQVHRCTADDGKVTYTDVACPNDAESIQLEAAKSPEQIAENQRRAAQALEEQAQQRLSRQKELRLKAETAALEASAGAQRAAEAAARIQAFDYTETAACRQATRALERLRARSSDRASNSDWERLASAQDAADRACLSPKDYATTQRARAAQPPPQTIVVTPPSYPPHYGRPPVPPGAYPTPWPTPQPPTVYPQAPVPQPKPPQAALPPPKPQVTSKPSVASGLNTRPSSGATAATRPGSSTGHTRIEKDPNAP